MSDQYVQSDAELVQAVRDRRIEAFAILVERYERSVRANAYSIVQDSHAAEDIAQEVFVTAYGTLDRLRDDSRFGAWLLGITRRCSLKWLRSKRRSPLPIATIPSSRARRTEN